MKIRRTYRKTTFKILKLLSISLSAVMGVFCNFGGCMYGPAPEYGMPHADYQVSGAVHASSNDEPIEGILVSITNTSEFPETLDSSKTDSLGRYSLEFSQSPGNSSWKLSAKDVDSTENGTFLPKDTIITFAESELKDPSGNWYEGHAEINVDLKIDRDN